MTASRMLSEKKRQKTRNKLDMGKYAELFEGHDYLEDYVRQIHQLSQSEITGLMTRVLKSGKSGCRTKKIEQMAAGTCL